MIKSVHITEWIKILFAGVALIIGINEFVLKNDQIETTKLENTRAFLIRGSEQDILESLSLTIKHAQSVEKIQENERIEILFDMTPLHEYLKSWALCISSDLCDSDSSKEFFCRRLQGYEVLAKSVYRRTSLQYDVNRRDALYSGLLKECARGHALPS